MSSSFISSHTVHGPNSFIKHLNVRIHTDILKRNAMPINSYQLNTVRQYYIFPHSYGEVQNVDYYLEYRPLSAGYCKQTLP